MLKFGAITIDTSHPMAFAKQLAGGDRGRYTAIFNDGFRGQDEVDSFANHHGLTVCQSVEELADLVDIGMVHACNWDKHLGYIAAFAERNKPIFIDKPLVGNLQDAQKLLELVHSGAKVLGSSSLRYCYEVEQARTKAANAGATILHVNISVGVDEFNYAIHAFAFACALLNDKPVSVRHIGRSESNRDICDHYFLRFAGGATAIINNIGKKFTSFHTVVLTDAPGGDSCFTVAAGKLYEALLNEVCNELEGKENALAPMEELLIPIYAALAGKASKLASGKEIALDDPSVAEVSFDGYAFEAGYSVGAGATKSYLNL